MAGLLWNGGTSAASAENVPKLPVAVHDTAFYADFEDEACMEDWLVVDANEDGNSWNWVSGSGVGYSACLQFRGNGRTPDDWAISPVFALESGRTYKLSYFYNMLYYNEKVEVYLGTARETASMGRMLSSQDVTTYGWASTVFSVEESGNYCLGIKAASEAVTRPGLYIDEVSVCEEILGTVPGPVQDLTQVPGENGALTMGLSWTNPSADEAGNALQSLSGIEIYKNYGNDNIAGSLNLQAGAQVTWTDPDPQPGKVVYHVYAVNASGRSYAASVNTYVGEDLPSAPRNLQAEVSGSTVNLSWEAPGEFGLNGGWYDRSGLSYIVARNGQNYAVLNASATGTSLTDTPEGMDMYYYEVTAKSASGQGGKPHVPFRQGVVGQSRQCAEYGQIGIFLDGAAQNALMTGRGRLAQDNAGNGRFRLEMLQTGEQRRRSPGHFSAVEADHDGAAQGAGQAGGGAGTLRVQPVIQAAIAFQQRQQRRFRGELTARSRYAEQEIPAQLLRRQKIRIEIAGRSSGSQREPGGVNIVRPLLEGDNFPAGRAQGSRQTERKQRFAAAAGNGGNTEPGTAAVRRGNGHVFHRQFHQGVFDAG